MSFKKPENLPRPLKPEHRPAGGPLLSPDQVDNVATLKRFIDSNIIGVHRADVYGNFVEVNDAFAEMIGYSRDELLSGAVRWDQITPGEHSQADAAAVEQLKQTGRAIPWEKEYVHKDGHRVPVLIGVVATDQSRTQCFTFTIDLSKRKRYEAQLRESESKFRYLAEAVPPIVWTADPSVRVDFCSQRFYELTGLNQADDDGFLWKKAIHPDDFPQVMEEAARAIAEKRRYEMEIRYITADGGYRWQLVSALPTFDSQGNVIKWYGSNTDIDEKKQAESELKESEARFRTLAEAIPQIVWTADASGQITFCNQRWFEYTGLTLEQSLAEGWKLLIHPEDLELYLRQWTKALETGDSWEMEFRVKRAVGLGKCGGSRYRWHLGRAVALRSSNGIIMEWFGTWTDIEDQKNKPK